MAKMSAVPGIGDGQPVWRSKWAKWFFVFVLVSLPTSVVLILKSDEPAQVKSVVTCVDTMRHISALDIFVYAFWALIPPTWFFLEYNYHFPQERKRDPLSMEDMKYTQELGGKFWSGILIFLGMILLLKYGIHLG
jgi:hypothetical protein